MRFEQVIIHLIHLLLLEVQRAMKDLGMGRQLLVMLLPLQVPRRTNLVLVQPELLQQVELPVLLPQLHCQFGSKLIGLIVHFDPVLVEVWERLLRQLGLLMIAHLWQVLRAWVEQEEPAA